MSNLEKQRLSLEQQHQEIQDRLDRYCDLFLGIKEDEKDTEMELVTEPIIDIFKELACLRDTLTDSKIDLCFCERENSCQCASEEKCECDGEDFYTVSEVKIIEGSNSNLILEFLTLEDVSISRLKNVRFFTLDKETDDENWIMDLIKTIEKRKKKKVVCQYFLETKCRDHSNDRHIQYEIFDIPHLRGKRIQIKIDYLQYHQL